MLMLTRILLGFLVVCLALAIIAAGLLGFAVAVTYPKLPSLEVLTDYRPKIPLRIYTRRRRADWRLGEERRAFTRIQDVPQLMKQVIAAAEDERFYQHGGIDYVGVARDMFQAMWCRAIPNPGPPPSPCRWRAISSCLQKNLTRKSTKPCWRSRSNTTSARIQILELYFNQIYLGQRAYGLPPPARRIRPPAERTVDCPDGHAGRSAQGAIVV